MDTEKSTAHSRGTSSAEYGPTGSLKESPYKKVVDVKMDKKTHSGLCEEFVFPHDEFQMAKVIFNIEFSELSDVNWGETWKGLLDFFAISSHSFYLELANLINKGSVKTF